ncbi:MAG: cytochrome b/b6 domain-containing protein [Pseudomonadales bacterium]|nr:cytochrome b/b6 domain-containing protein [Pseudomonadales bacterium]
MGEGIVRYKYDVWGEEVILGVSWDLLWVVAVAVLILLAAHAIIMAVLANKKMDKPSSDGRRVLRHETIDRLFHWIMAGSILLLILTGVAPIIGLRIAWLNLHWIAGLVLTFVVIFHIVRSLFWQDFKSMILGPRDFGEPFDSAKKPGKYSFEQKGMHWAVTVVVLAVVVTGLLMFLQIDTPFWDRTNSMPESQLGLVFLLHGLSTLALVALAASHIYFALRPEKLFYTRSMISGWISEDEMTANHDTSRWSPEEAD